MRASGPVTTSLDPAATAASTHALHASLRRATDRDVAALHQLLTDVDLTVAGLDDPSVRLWVVSDADGTLVASTGFELSADGRHALVRSVAVRPSRRGAGHGTFLARFALDAAAAAGATQAWLFSRRSGPFWQRLGFERTGVDELVAALPEAHQVRLFARSGQLAREVAWSRPLG